MRVFRISFFILSGLALALTAGCKPAAEEVPVTAAPPVEAPVSTEAPPATAPVVLLEPDAMPDCAPPAVVKVHWDARSSGATSVDIMVVDRQGNEKLFFTGGQTGSRDTGPWMRSRTQVAVRDHADGRELGRATIAGTPCAKGAATDAG